VPAAPEESQATAAVLRAAKEALTPANVLLTVGLLVVALTAAFGGMEARPTSVAEPALSTSITARPFEVTVEGGYTTARWPGAGSESATSRYIVLTGEVKNTSDRFVEAGVTADLLRLEAGVLTHNGQRTTETARVPPVTLRGGASLTPASPGVAVRVTWVFEQPNAEPAPASVGVFVRGRTWREDSLSGGMAWLDPEDVARVQVPLEVR